MWFLKLYTPGFGMICFYHVTPHYVQRLIMEIKAEFREDLQEIANQNLVFKRNMDIYGFQKIQFYTSNV